MYEFAWLNADLPFRRKEKRGKILFGEKVEQNDTSRPRAEGVINLYNELDYCAARPTIRISTRRFCARPFLVLLLTTGIVSPIPVVIILLASTP